MNIVIDGYEANVRQRLGSSQVAFELLRNLEKIDQRNNYFVLLPSDPLADLPQEREGWGYKVIKFNKLWTKLALPLALYRSKFKPDLVFSPTHYIPQFSPAKRVATIFDLSYLHFPQMFKKNDLWKLTHGSGFSIKHADHIITISNFSKRDIIKNYHISKSKITVAYPGFDQEHFFPIGDEARIAKVKASYNIQGEYLIYVGTIQPRKNLLRLMEGFKQVIKDYRNEQLSQLSLVIVGKTQGEGRSGWMFKDILEAPERLGISEQVIFTGYVQTDELACLINGSQAMVLVSLWEGFGLPVVDCMACGVPVIVSNVSSLPEVVGNTGLLVDPYSEDQIAQAIRTIITDKKLRKLKSMQVLSRAKRFTWKKMAQTVLEVFETQV